MREIVACSYLGLFSPDLEAWRDFATALGMQISEATTSDTLYLRCDERAYRVFVERGEITPNHGVNCVGWEVRSSTDLDSLVERMRKAGHEVTEDEKLAKKRRVDRLFRAVDPGGNNMEFFCGIRKTEEAFYSPTGVKFITGATTDGDTGFGHVVVTYNDMEAAQKFYVDLLGFKISDVCILGGTRWLFLHVNPRHHSLAFGAYPVQSAFHHFMLEVDNVDMVGACHDRLTKLGAAFTTTIGRHNNDRMFSFYVRTPSGIQLEYGCEGLLIDDESWIVTTYDGSRIWGHQNVQA